MALRARARAADKCSRGLRRPRDMEGVLDIRRPEVEVVVGPVVRRGDVRKAREGPPAKKLGGSVVLVVLWVV